MAHALSQQVMGFDGPWPYANQKSYVLTRGGTKHELPPNVVTHPGPITALVDEINNTDAKRIWVIGGAQYVVAYILSPYVPRPRFGVTLWLPSVRARA